MDDALEQFGNLSPEKRALLALRLRKKEREDQPAGSAAITRHLRAAMPGPFPLSFAQERLWLLDQLQPGNPVYNISFARRLIGRLDRAALGRTFNAIVERHETLRTTFAVVADQPAQIVGPAWQVPLPVVDVSALAPPEQQAAMRGLAAEEQLRPFDLERGPLLRVVLARLGPEEHVLLLIAHHIVADGWSLGVLFQELVLFYAAFSDHREADAVPELPIQYADYALWERTRLQGAVVERKLAYWTQRLGGSLPVLELPTDRPRPPVQTFAGASQRFVLPAALAQVLRALSRRAGGTLFMALLAAFKVLLYRYTGQEDLIVGSPIANRNQREVEGLIGLFANTLALRSSLSAEPSFAELLARVKQTTVEAYTHRELPFERLVAALQPARHLSHSPVFQVAFSLHNASAELFELPGLRLQPFEIASETVQFDLFLAVTESASGELLGSWEYNRDLFDSHTLTRMTGHFETLLKSIVAHPELPISVLPLLSEAEQALILMQWNATAAEYPRELCLHEICEAQAARTPDAVAVTFEGRHLTYRRLDRRANQLAHYLRRHGVGPEMLVGVCLERSPDLLVGLLGVHKAGGAYVPLDPAYPAQRLAFMLEDSRAAVLLTTTDDRRPTTDDRRPTTDPSPPLRVGDRRPKIEDSSVDVSQKRSSIHHPPSSFVSVVGGQWSVVDLNDDWDVIAREAETAPAVALAPDNLAYVIYTSGSTGTPKGVQIRHSSLINFLDAMRQKLGFTVRDSLFALTTLSFDIAALELFLPVSTGGRVELASREVATDGVLLAARLAAAKPSFVQATPATWRLLLEAGWAGGTNVHILCGGEALPRQLANQLVERAAAVWNMYGPTETTVWSSVGRVETGDEALSIGRPIHNTQFYLLDSRLNPVPVGVPGELYIGGEGLARGYLGRPELTAERFIPNPFAGRGGEEERGRGGEGETVQADRPPVSSSPLLPLYDRLYKTGDLARYRSDGQIEFMGRLDQQVKLRGYRIELGEIESALVSHVAVSGAVVALREDRSGERRLVAYVVQGSGARDQGSVEQPAESLIPDPRSLIPELRAYLKQRLPDHMVPSAFVPLEALPLMPNGKLDRRALPAPETGVAPDAGGYVPPSTPVQELLAGIWERVLGVERLGLDDNFFALGGNSLLAARIISRVREAFKIDLSLRMFFEMPTIAQLAQQIELARRPAQGVSAQPLKPVGREDSLPLSLAQQRLWFLEQLEPGNIAYNIPAAVRVSGMLDLGLLERSLNEVVRRHEVLRTTFAGADGRPIQVIAPALEIALALVDVQALPEQDRRHELQQIAAVEASQPFDLSRGPLIRATVVRQGAQEHSILLTMHHIISDGWSMGVLIREVAQLYRAYSAGRPSPLAELAVQYADFAVWQRGYLRAKGLESDLAYWNQQLGDELPILELPTDRPRPARQSFRGARWAFVLPRPLAEALRALSRRENTTLFMTLLTGFQVLLSRYTGQLDSVVGSPVAHRNRPQLEGLIGFFVNMLALRTDLSGGPSFLQVLKRVRETTLDAYAHQDLPFEMVVEALQPKRDLSRSPLFQAIFTLQQAPLEASGVPGLTLTPVEVEHGTAQVDLALSITETVGELPGSLEYSTDLFDRATIERMAGHFETLLAGIVADPEHASSRLPLLSEAERQHILRAWNDTYTAPRPDTCLHTLFLAQVEDMPDAVALAFEDQLLTYAELNRRSNQLAHRLHALGVGPEVRVGVCMERSLELVIALLGVLKAGGAYVPLDPAYPPARLAYMLEDAQVSVLLTSKEIGDRRLEVDAASQSPISNLQSPTTLYLDTDWPTIAQEPMTNPKADVTPNNLAYLIYTSGSTGRPKGVMVAHAGVCNLILAQIRDFGVRPGSRVLQFASFSFDASVSEIFTALLSGATLCLARPADLLPDQGLLGLLRERRISTVTLPPAVLRGLAPQHLPDLETVISAGETCDWSIVQRWAEGRRFLNGYGPTETTVGCCWGRVDRRTYGSRTMPIGRPIDNVQLYILDAQLQPVPIGVTGELYITGAGIARGYLGLPALTAERFIPNPFVENKEQRTKNKEQRTENQEPFSPVVGGRRSAVGGRLYRTGDLARYLPDGEIEFLGRLDHQVKLRGFRIELGEIESALVSHPAIGGAAVALREDRSGERRLVAYLVPTTDHRPPTTDSNDKVTRRQGDKVSVGAEGFESAPSPLHPFTPSSQELRAYLKQRLPGHMIPSAFVLLEALPLMPNGKLDLRGLPAPQRNRPGLETAFVEPRTPLEQTVAGIWSELLGVDHIGVHDSFFDLGGHSLLATQAVSRIREASRVEVALRTLFEGPTIAELAQAIDEARGAGSPHLTPSIIPQRDMEEIEL